MMLPASAHVAPMRQTASRGLLKSAAMAAAAGLALGLGLWALSWSFGKIGGIADYPSVLSFELPYLLVLFLGLAYLMRPGPWRVLIAGAPIVAVYLTMDLHYVLLHSVFKLDDLLLIPEALAVAPAWVLLVVSIVAVGWLTVFAYQLKRRGRELAAPLALLAVAAAPPAAAYLAPARFLDAAELRGLQPHRLVGSLHRRGQWAEPPPCCSSRPPRRRRSTSWPCKPIHCRPESRLRSDRAVTGDQAQRPHPGARIPPGPDPVFRGGLSAVQWNRAGSRPCASACAWSPRPCSEAVRPRSSSRCCAAHRRWSSTAPQSSA